MNPSRVGGLGVARDRRLRIELLRMRAGYERLRFTHDGCALARSLRPEALGARARDHLQAMGLGWLGRGLSLTQRFPMLLSLVSAMLSGRGRRRILVKSLLIGGLIWLGRHPPRKDGAPS